MNPLLFRHLGSRRGLLSLPTVSIGGFSPGTQNCSMSAGEAAKARPQRGMTLAEFDECMLNAIERD